MSDVASASGLDGPRLAPASGSTPQSLVVFLHGYGADGNDLIGIGREWAKFLPHTAFVSPHAPEPCAQAPVGRQWFTLTMRDPHEYWRGVMAAGPQLQRFIAEEQARLGVPPARTALVGFSQGTMMALHVGPRSGSALAGILGFSGHLAGPEHLEAEMTAPAPVMLVHGDQDEIIPVQAMMMAAQGFAAAGASAEWHVCYGLGHGIDPRGLGLGAHFLAQCLTR